MRKTSFTMLLLALLSLALVGCDSNVAATPTAVQGVGGTADNDAAVQYCKDKGGTVRVRYPVYGTNNPQSQWIRLGNDKTLCEFSMQGSGGGTDLTSIQVTPTPASGSDANVTRIMVDVNTLYSDKPTLAATAYLAKIPLKQSGGANPAAVQCNRLGGTDQFGPNSAAGGGWVSDDADTFQVISMCLFADDSMIEEWGIAYYSAGIIRGADLKPLFRWQPTTLPNFFGGVN
ncbi:MAG: hypothetical protein WCD37_01965 [Chloroflexia bacterium]